MKIIEALKQIKSLQRKASDLRDKIQNCAVKMSYESDRYDDQRGKVTQWLQSHHDLMSEIENLRESVARTNLETPVTIELGGREVTKSIHRWLTRRQDLCELDCSSWKMLHDRGLTDQRLRAPSGETTEFQVVRFYDPSERDKMIQRYEDELVLIDSKLEIVNATTELV